MVVEQLGDVQQQVVEIDGRRGQQPLLVGRIDLGHDVAQRAARRAARSWSAVISLFLAALIAAASRSGE